MICPKCGSTIIDNANQCSQCGYILKKQKHIMPIIIIILVCLVLSLSVFLTFVFLKPIYNMKTAIKNNDIVNIITTYQSNTNEYLVNIYNHQIDDYASSLISDCQNNEEHIEVDIDHLTQLLAIYDTSKHLSQLFDISESKNAYHKAYKYENEDSDMLSAIDEYRKVIEIDTQYYIVSRQKIEELSQEIYNKAKESIKESLFSTMNYISHLDDNYPDPDGIRELCDKYGKWCGLYYSDGIKEPIVASDIYFPYNNDNPYWDYGQQIYAISALATIPSASKLTNYDFLYPNVHLSLMLTKFLQENNQPINISTMSIQKTTWSAYFCADGTINLNANNHQYKIYRKN